MNKTEFAVRLSQVIQKTKLAKSVKVLNDPLAPEKKIILILQKFSEDTPENKMLAGIELTPSQGKRLYKELGLSEKKHTTDDMLFTVETVSCLGACGLAPVMTVNDEVHPAMTPEKVTETIKKIKEGENE